MGFKSVVLRLPSPKSHIKLDITAPGPAADVFVKLIVVGKQPVVLSWVKSAVGTGNTVIVSVIATLVPLALVAVCVTTYFPGAEYNAAVVGAVLPVGLTCAAVPPKFQFQAFGPFEEASLNETASGAQPE